MYYKINVYKLAEPKGDIRANVSISFNDCVVVKGIRIREKNDGRLFVDMPKKISPGAYQNKVLVLPKGDFGKVLLDNIIDTYKNDNETCELPGGAKQDEDMNYTVQIIPVHKGNCVAVANVILEDVMVISDFRIMSGKNGIFVSNPSIACTNGSYLDICYPLTQEFREELHGNILSLCNIEEFLKEKQEFDDLNKALAQHTRNADSVKNFAVSIYEKINETDDESLTNNYMTDLGVAVCSYMDECKIIEQLTQDIDAKKKQNMLKHNGR